jgi:hypothetical protein
MIWSASRFPTSSARPAKFFGINMRPYVARFVLAGLARSVAMSSAKT